MKNRLLIALILLLLLSTYNIQGKFSLSTKYNVQEILIENCFILKPKNVKNKLSYLYKKNLFILNTKDIEVKLREIELVESFEIKKIYPNKIIIRVFEKKPIAIIQDRKEKKIYTSKGEIINFLDLEIFKNLPLVFGDKESFKILLKNLKKVNFSITEIKTFYLFESKRWDLVTRKNQTIKLPAKNYEKNIKNFIDLKEQENFEKYKIFDYRINDQLILK